MYAPVWHPTLQTIGRPNWMAEQPSPAAMSYNYAINQYTQPLSFCARYCLFENSEDINAQYSQLEEIERQLRGMYI